MILMPIASKAHQAWWVNRRAAITVAVLSCLGMIYVAITMYRTVSLEIARNEIAKAGGTIQIPGFHSRYVFQNAAMKPSDLSQLTPYLNRIPPTRDVNAQLPPCRVLDFTTATAITFVEASDLLRDMDSTMVLFTHNGRPSSVMTPDLRSHLDREARTKR